MLASQGPRSSSVSGSPRDILATFAGGWNVSPSWNAAPNPAARRAPTVVLPQPLTPISSTITGRPRSIGSRGLLPALVEGPRAVDAREAVRAEKIPLRLDHVGPQPSRPVGIDIGERRGERRHGDAGHRGVGD